MDSPFIGMIASFGFNFAPVNWAYCSGQTIAISQNQALYSLIGCAFGGDCRLTFGYPDLRARAPIGSVEMGHGPGLTTYQRGTKGGTQLKQLGIAELPTHNHNAIFTPSGGGGAVSVDIAVSTVDGDTATPNGTAFLSKAPQISFTDVKMFQTNTGVATQPLGGVTVTGGGSGGGVVTVNNSGLGDDFYIQNPFTALNYCIAELGLYPSRN